ncbi:hypothetical protein GmHk_20G057825 [Glycine max]|nr:hypothetical protein GmHk_20G057825 [Glycine max]
MTACIRDLRGNFILVMTSYFSRIPTPWRMKPELFLMPLAGYPHENTTIKKSNCKKILDCIKIKKFQNNEARDILRCCVHRLSSLQNYHFQFVSRQTNQLSIL